MPSSFLITRWNIFKGKFTRKVEEKQNKAPSESNTHKETDTFLENKPYKSGSLSTDWLVIHIGTAARDLCPSWYRPMHLYGSLCIEFSSKSICFGLSIRSGMILRTFLILCFFFFLLFFWLGDLEYSPLTQRINVKLPFVFIFSLHFQQSLWVLAQKQNSPFWPTILSL